MIRRIGIDHQSRHRLLGTHPPESGAQPGSGARIAADALAMASDVIEFVVVINGQPTFVEMTRSGPAKGYERC